MTWAALALLALAVAIVTWKVVRMAGELERLETEVSEIGDVVESAVTLIENLAELVRGAGTDPGKLAALADSLDAKAARLAQAVVANTPADPDVLPPDAPPGGEGT